MNKEEFKNILECCEAKMVKIVKIADMRVLSEDGYIGSELTDVDTGQTMILAKWMGRSNGYMPAKGKIRTVKAGLKSGAWKLTREL